MSKYESKLKLKINGINVYNFIKKLKDNNINLYDINIISIKSAYIIIIEKDYKKVLKLKNHNEVIRVRSYGIINIKEKIERMKYIIITCVICMISMYVVSNIIFKIEVIHSNSSLRNLVLEQINKYGIKEFSFNKSYQELEEIKSQILNDNKEKIEWIEIIKKGNKYTIRVEERIIPEEVEEVIYQDIVASKSGIIQSIVAKDGVIVKKVNDFVKKGEVLISGLVYLNENLKNLTMASGEVYAEVWYNVVVDYPLYYKEEIYSTNSNNVFKLNFFENSSNDYYNFLEKEMFKIEHAFLPISFSYGKYSNVVINESIYTVEEAITKALELSKTKVESMLDSTLNERILDEKVLNFTQKDGNINIEIFYKVYENISESKSISMEE